MLSASAVCAVGSMALTPPSAAYLGYLDGRVLILLFSLMAVVSLLLFLILTIWSHHLTSQLTDQQAAQRWDKDGKSVQVSCYFTDQVKLTDMEFIGFKKKLEQMLKETLPADEYSEENDRRLVVDGYSAMGKVTVLSEKGKLTDADAIGIGGDYFLFHPVKLLSGGYFTGEDLMQDSIILDTEGAWQLFGSNDIVGKSVMIGGVPHYVAGVIERDGSKFAKSAGLNKTTVYLSDDSLQAYGTTAGISNYEVLAPNPVRHFVYNAVKDQLGVAEDDMVVVENTTRFKVESLIPVILEFGTRSMQNAAIRFPFWENVARGYEDVCALILIFQFLFLLIPGTILIAFFIWKWRHRTFTWKDLGNRIIDIRDGLRKKSRREKEKWENF